MDGDIHLYCREGLQMDAKLSLYSMFGVKVDGVINLASRSERQKGINDPYLFQKGNPNGN